MGRSMSRRSWILLAVGLAVALGIALLSPLASGSPDGLERVAEDQGFLDEAEDAPYHALPDYTIPGIGDERASTILAGVVGVLVAAAATLGAGWLIRRRSHARQRPGRSPSAPESR